MAKKSTTGEAPEEAVVAEPVSSVFTAGRAVDRLLHSSIKRLFTPELLEEGTTYDVLDNDGDKLGCLCVSNHVVLDVRTLQLRDAVDAGFSTLQAFLNDWFRTLKVEDYDTFIRTTGGVHPTRVTSEFKAWMRERPEEEVLANVYEIEFTRQRVVNVKSG